MPEPQVTIAARGLRRIEAGHPWIYKSDILAVSASAGDIVRVLSERGRFVGRAFYSDRSQIALRFLTRDDLPVDRDFLLDRIRKAAERRHTWVTNSEVFRVVYSEGDLLPSLIVDRYGDVLVIQTLSQATEKLKSQFVDILVELFSPAAVIERNDPRSRLQEGLSQTVSTLHGNTPSTVVAQMNGLRFGFDLLHGQKTGAFLDQRENYQAARKYAFGDALDCFTYNGAFALTIASQCQSVQAIDFSPDAIEGARRNQELNQIANVSFRVENAFDALRQFADRGRTFDTVILDPPAFAKNKASLAAALRGYKEINLRSLKLLRPGGYLVTASCSHHLAEPEFLGLIAQAGLDAGKQLVVVERRTQSADHPILLTVPETSYLKLFILRAI